MPIWESEEPIGLPPTFATCPIPPTPPQQIWFEDFFQVLGSSGPELSLTFGGFMEPLDFFVYNRFGFTWWLSGPAYIWVEGVSQVLDQPAWNQVLRMLVAEPAAPPLVQEEYKVPIANFVHLMLTNQSLPGALW